MSDAATLTVAEVADAIGLSQSAVYEKVRTGAIPNVGLGRTVRVPRLWLERHFVAAGCALEMPIETGGFTFT